MIKIWLKKRCRKKCNVCFRFLHIENLIEEMNFETKINKIGLVEPNEYYDCFKIQSGSPIMH
jgi:hypothetical protein